MTAGRRLLTRAVLLLVITLSAACASGNPTTDGQSRAEVSPQRPLRVVVVGDSVSETIAAGVSTVSLRQGVRIINDGTIGCGVTTLSPYIYFGARHTRLHRCFRWQRHWRWSASSGRPDVVMIIVGRWEIMDQRLNGHWMHIGQPAFNDYVLRQLQLGYLAVRHSGRAVVFCTAPYYRRGTRPDGGLWPEDHPARVDAYNKLLRHFVAQHAKDTTIVDLNARTAGGRHTYVNRIDGIELRYDGVHFRPQAGRWLAPWLLPQLKKAATRVNG